MRRLDQLVLKNGLIAALLCAGMVLALGVTGLILIPMRQAHARAAKSLDHAVASLNVDFDQAQRTAHGLRALWAQTPGTMKNPSRLQALQPLLEHNGLIMNLIFAKADGETLLILRAEEGWNMILIPPGASHPVVFRAREGKWFPAESVGVERTFQARERPWFHLAQAVAAPTWTRPYRFTPSSSGYTYVVPERNGARLEAVVAVDVALEDLERQVRTLLPGEFRVLVTDPGGQVLVAPEPSSPRDRLAREARLLVPVSAGTLAEFQRPGLFRFQRRAPIRTQGPSMEIRVDVGPEALVPGLRLRLGAAVLASILAFGGLMAYVRSLHRHLVRPIRRLAGKEASGAGPSEIWEFRQLEASIQRLGQTEADRQQILRQLEHSQRVETMGNMAPGIIHDLNNHLAVILAQLELCTLEVAGAPSAQARLDRAERATLRCSQAIRGLLEFSRAVPEQKVAFHLNEQILGTVSLLEPVLKEAVSMETRLEDGLPILRGEPVKLQQVLVNLALNARDAMGGSGVLTFRTRREAGGILLEVQDTGCGMTAEVKAKLFEPFFTTKEPGQGTGLGLTMVHRIVHAHGGTLEVASEPGQGTTFRIHLPAQVV